MRLNWVDIKGGKGDDIELGWTGKWGEGGSIAGEVVSFETAWARSMEGVGYTGTEKAGCRNIKIQQRDGHVRMDGATTRRHRCMLPLLPQVLSFDSTYNIHTYSRTRTHLPLLKRLVIVMVITLVLVSLWFLFWYHYLLYLMVLSLLL